MATYVLVHGGAHGGWCYGKVARLLRRAGHEVYTPTMTGLGEREHLLSVAIDLDMHIADIVNVLQFEDLGDVILVGHSYGGMVITGVADRASDRVGHLVFLDAATPDNGQSLEDVAGPIIRRARQYGETISGVETVLYPTLEPIDYFGVTDPADIDWMRMRLTPHPWRCYTQKLRLNNEAAVRRIPQTHILCTSTLQRRDIEALGRLTEGRLWDIDSGHDLMITEPEAVAELLLRIP